MGMFPIFSGDIASGQVRPAVGSQIERVRHNVQVYGQCIVPYGELGALCTEAVPPINYWEAIAKIAIDEGWSFTFFPDRSVRFAALSSCS
jgi:hypothetical protein